MQDKNVDLICCFDAKSFIVWHGKKRPHINSKVQWRKFYFRIQCCVDTNLLSFVFSSILFSCSFSSDASFSNFSSLFLSVFSLGSLVGGFGFLDACSSSSSSSSSESSLAAGVILMVDFCCDCCCCCCEKIKYAISIYIWTEKNDFSWNWNSYLI